MPAFRALHAGDVAPEDLTGVCPRPDACLRLGAAAAAGCVAGERGAAGAEFARIQVAHAAAIAPEFLIAPKRLTLIAAILGSGVVFLDGTVVNVALPAIREDLGTKLAEQQWIVEAYLLTLGSLLLVGGSLGDLFGRRRVFVAGLSGFGQLSGVPDNSSYAEAWVMPSRRVRPAPWLLRLGRGR